MEKLKQFFKSVFKKNNTISKDSSKTPSAVKPKVFATKLEPTKIINNTGGNMKLHILGTGNGGAIKCYNTCFAIENNNEYLLVDGGGGNQILNQLEKANINISKIHNIFLSHIHTDHILGLIWVIRKICQQIHFGNKYEGNLNVFGCDESVKTLKMLVDLLFPFAKKCEDRINYIEVKDKETVNINELDITFFDIKAKKDKQFGFVIKDKLCFSGDEPLNEELFDFAKNKEWLIHESFCLDKEEPVFQSHAKGHCTVKETATTAQNINAKNLIILHTEDNDLKNRKIDYTNEAKEHFSGNVFVPEDLEVIDL